MRVPLPPVVITDYGRARIVRYGKALFAEGLTPMGKTVIISTLRTWRRYAGHSATPAESAVILDSPVARMVRDGAVPDPSDTVAWTLYQWQHQPAMPISDRGGPYSCKRA